MVIDQFRRCAGSPHFNSTSSFLRKRLQSKTILSKRLGFQFRPSSTNVLAEVSTATSGFNPSWWPYALIQNTAYTINVYAGAPWWVSIILTTLGVRLALTPVMIASFRNSTKLSVIQPEMKKELEAIKTAKLDNDQLALNQHSIALRGIYLKHNVNPFAIFILPLTQSAVFFSFFYAIRKMSRLSVDGFTTGGLAWFKDLSIPDPYCILPIINAGLMFSGMQMNRANTASTIGNSTNWRTFFFLCCLLSPLLTAKLPAVREFSK